MSRFNTQLPANDAELRARLYTGEIFLTAPCAATLALVQKTREAISHLLALPTGMLPTGSAADLFHQLTPLRESLRHDAALWAPYLEAVLRRWGLAPDDYHVDAPRLRCIGMPEHYANASASAAFMVHRDTWYANPQSQINAWIPLQPIDPTNAVAFYPAHFARAVPNNSSAFNYERWHERAGWQATNPVPRDAYACVLENPALDEATYFSAEMGSGLLFSAQHLHGSQALACGVRFSLDFRIVHRNDAAHARGACNVDNESVGSVLHEYRYFDRVSDARHYC